jgi:hypothetical protein
MLFNTVLVQKNSLWNTLNTLETVHSHASHSLPPPTHLEWLFFQGLSQNTCSQNWDIFLHRRNQQLQPEKSLWSNRAWSYSSPFTKRPPKYLPFNASRALSASKSKGKINYFWVTTSYTQITVNSKKLYRIYPNASWPQNKMSAKGNVILQIYPQIICLLTKIFY